MKTLIILNPHAGSGRAGRLWSQIEPLLWKELGELVVAVTEKPEDVAQHLEKAHAADLKRVIAIGGDGTNHALVNELIRLNKLYPDEPPMTFGSLPIGTGRDWARTLGVPLNPKEAVEWIKAAHPAPLDVGRIHTDQIGDRHFVNIASAGISGLIAANINRLKTRRFWTFYLQTIKSLIAYQARPIKVMLDGKLWYEGESYVCVVANGTTFGRGMKVAPYAQYDDGVFDVVLIENMPRIEAMTALNSVYSGNHLKRKDVHSAQASTIEINTDGTPLNVEMDGETALGSAIRFDVLPRALNMLVR